MKNKGFLSLFELLIGMILVGGIWSMTTQPAQSPTNEWVAMICMDSLGAWIHGMKMDEIATEILPENTFTFSPQPLNETNESSETIVCHATRMRNGIMEEMFLRIEP